MKVWIRWDLPLKPEIEPLMDAAWNSVANQAGHPSGTAPITCRLGSQSLVCPPYQHCPTQQEPKQHWCQQQLSPPTHRDQVESEVDRHEDEHLSEVGQNEEGKERQRRE